MHSNLRSFLTSQFHPSLSMGLSGPKETGSKHYPFHFRESFFSLPYLNRNWYFQKKKQLGPEGCVRFLYMLFSCHSSPNPSKINHTRFLKGQRVKGYSSVCCVSPKSHIPGKKKKEKIMNNL